MKWNAAKLCFTADDGSRLERSGADNGCRGHGDVSDGFNKYKCAKAFCNGDWTAWLLRELYDVSPRRNERVATLREWGVI